MNHGGFLINGRRLDEIVYIDMPFMNERQLGDCMQLIMDQMSDIWWDIDEIGMATAARYEYFESLVKAENEAGVKAGLFILGEYDRVYERDTNARMAVEMLLPCVKEVYLDRKHREEQRGQDRIMMAKINSEENLSLDISAVNMIVEFQDGRRIEFTNSEWGSLTRIK